MPSGFRVLRRVTDELSEQIAECDEDAARRALQDNLHDAHNVTSQLGKLANALIEAYRQKQLQQEASKAEDEHVIADTDTESHDVTEPANADTASTQASATATDDLARMKQEMLDLKRSLNDALASAERERELLRKSVTLSRKTRTPRVNVRPNVDVAVFYG